MIDDLEDGNLNTLQSFPWWGWQDGSASTTSRTNIVGGAGGTTRHLLISGNMGANLSCGAGCFYGYWGLGTDTSGISVPEFSRLRFWGRKSFPALGWAGITVWVVLNNGDGFSQEISASLPAGWTYVDLDLSTFTADPTNTYMSFTGATGTITQMGMSVDTWNPSSAPGNPYSLEIDEIQYARP